MSTSVSWPPIGGTTYSIPASGELNWQALSTFLIAIGNSAQGVNNTKLAIRVATTTPVTVASTTDTVIVVDLLVAGATTVNLPAGITGQTYFIVDGKGDAATNNITIDPNSTEQINGALTYVISKNRAGVLISFNGTSWNVLAEYVSIAAGTIPRSSIAAGSANQVVINDGSGNLSSEATLAKSRGGTGADNSSVTFPSTGTITTDAGSTTLTNKTISGATNTITNVSLTTGVTGTLPLANGGTGQTSASAAFDALSPNTTKGDITARTSSTNARLAVGTDGQALTASSAATTGLAWANVLTNPMTTAGDVIVGGVAGAPARLAVGSTAQYLTVTSGTPAWTTLIQTGNINTANTDTVLTASSNRIQVFTSFSAGRNITLPTTSVAAGEMFTLVNTQAFDMSVFSSNGTEILVANGANYDASLHVGFVRLIALQATPTTPAHWLVLEAVEQYEFSGTFTVSSGGGSLSSTGGNFVGYRTNNLVNIYVQAGFTVSGTVNGITSANVVPARLRPYVTTANFSSPSSTGVMMFTISGTTGTCLIENYTTLSGLGAFGAGAQTQYLSIAYSRIN